MARCPLGNTELTQIGANALFLHCSAGPHEYSIVNNELSLIPPVFISQSALVANTALPGALVGTPVTPVALAANSLLIANILSGGGILIAANKSGTSYMAFQVDAATGDTLVGVPTGQSFDTYIAGTKEIDYTTGALAFQQATTISTTTGNLTLTLAPVSGSNLVLTAAGAGRVVLTNQVAFVASDKYVVVDASGNIHVSAVGPAS